MGVYGKQGFGHSCSSSLVNGGKISAWFLWKFSGSQVLNTPARTTPQPLDEQIYFLTSAGQTIVKLSTTSALYCLLIPLFL